MSLPTFGLGRPSSVVKNDRLTEPFIFIQAVPLISLAITTSGANLSSSLPESISPSRLLQASAFLAAADEQFNIGQQKSSVRVGPAFDFKLYTIFSASSRTQNQRSDVQSNISWKEEFARCSVFVRRVPCSKDKPLSELQMPYEYVFEIVENFRDERYHNNEDLASLPSTPPSADSRNIYYRPREPELREITGLQPGRARQIPLSIVNRLFFSASGKLLNIEESRSPVLVLKLRHKDPAEDASASLSRHSSIYSESMPASAASIVSNFIGGKQERTMHSDRRAREPAVSDEEDEDDSLNVEWIAFERYWDPAEGEDGSESDSDENEFHDAQDTSVKSEEASSISQGGYDHKENFQQRARLSKSNDKFIENNRRRSSKKSLGDEEIADEIAKLAISPIGRKNASIVSSTNVQDDFSNERELMSGMTAAKDAIHTSDYSLSLFEYIARLAACQMTVQMSIFRITDEQIVLFLRDENQVAKKYADYSTLDMESSPMSPSSIRRTSGMHSPQDGSSFLTPSRTSLLRAAMPERSRNSISPLMNREPVVAKDSPQRAQARYSLRQRSSPLAISQTRRPSQ